MKRLMAVMWMLWPLILLGQAPPVLRQPFTTNAAVPVMLLATNVATNSVRLAIGPNVTITEAGTAGGFTYTIGAALIGGGASLSDVTNRITSVMLTNDGAQVVAYVIGANGTNFVYSIGANGTNFTYAIGANSTNFTYLIGANGTNFALTIGLACTNQGNAYSVALSNLCYVIGSNGTNFTYAVGANGTNFSLTVGLACTNQGNSYSVALSNLCYVIGANSTNFTYSIGANGTNFAYLLGANSTNFTYSIGANGTNFSYLIGANGTNFGYAIGASATNHVNWLSNLLATAFPKIAVTNLVADNMTVTNITNSGYIVLGGTPRNTWPSGSTISIQDNGGVPLSGIDMVNFIHNTNMGVFVTSGGGSVGNVTFNSKFTIQTNTVNAFAGATTLNLIQGANVSFLSTNRGTTNDLQLIATGGGGGGGDLYFSKMSASQFTTNGSVVIIKTEADLTNIIHHGNVLFTNDTSFSMVLDPDQNNSSEIVFNQRGNVTPFFRIYANSDGDRLRFYNGGNLMMDLAGNIVIYTNLYVRNDLHVGGAIFTNPPILLEPLTNRPLFLGPHHGVTNGWVDMPMLESTVTSASNSIARLDGKGTNTYLTNAIIQSASATNLATYGTVTSDTTNGPIQLVRGDWATNIANSVLPANTAGMLTNNGAGVKGWMAIPSGGFDTNWVLVASFGTLNATNIQVSGSGPSILADLQLNSVIATNGITNNGVLVSAQSRVTGLNVTNITNSGGMELGGTYRTTWPSAGGSAAGGSGAVQFGQGTDFAGTNDFLFDRTNNLLRVTGGIQVTNGSTNSYFDALNTTNLYQRGTNIWDTFVLFGPRSDTVSNWVNAVSNRLDTFSTAGSNNVTQHTNINAGAVGGLTVTNNVLYLTATTNIWSGTTGTNLWVNFNVPSVTIWATNGFSLTNFVGLETGEGTSTKYLDMEIIGCTNTANVLVFPTLGGNQFSVRMLTNSASPISLSIASGIRYQFSWRAKGTNLTLVSAAFQ